MNLISGTNSFPGLCSRRCSVACVVLCENDVPIPQDVCLFIIPFGHCGVLDKVQPKISPKILFFGMYQTHLFIIGIGPILNKEPEIIYRYACYDRTYVYS